MHTLPSQVFFQPTEKFTNWMETTPWLRYRRIVDCGAGMGAVGYALKNHDVVGIDIMHREEYLSPVQFDDATQYDFDGDEVVLIARPCHGGWHENAYKRAIRNGCHDMLYIGLHKNLPVDFGDDWVIEEILTEAGEDGESIWRVFGLVSQCKTFGETACGLSGELITRNGEQWLVNYMGGGMPVRQKPITRTWLRLDHSQDYFDPAVFAENSIQTTSAINASAEEWDDKGQYGWVAPDGAWWPCGSRDHDTLIYDCFGLKTSHGWVKCYGTFWSLEEDRFSHHSPKTKAVLNLAQKKTLARVGYSLRDEELPEERKVATLSTPEQAAFGRCHDE